MLIARLRALYKPHERWLPIAFFLLGFVFDSVMLTRIDDRAVILQQALYLMVVSALIAFEIVQEVRAGDLPPLPSKARKVREMALHFLLGTLMNSYAIFYFKSASAFSSLFFIALLIGLLTLTEFKHFGKSQTRVHVALLSLCVISFFTSLAPILLGYIGRGPFLAALLGSILFFVAYAALIRARLRERPEFFRPRLLYPYALIQLVFTALYFCNAIPPVPLSVKFMGIYHGVKKSGGGYALEYTRSAWKFWQHGDQSFSARPGDVVFCYAQIFSPTSFQDQIRVRWMFHNEKQGWISSDAIPLSVTGGREEGYRAVTQKTHFEPGTWRVQIETMDEQEIGRIGFEVIADDTTGVRETRVEIRN